MAPVLPLLTASAISPKPTASALYTGASSTPTKKASSAPPQIPASFSMRVHEVTNNSGSESGGKSRPSNFWGSEADHATQGITVEAAQEAVEALVKLASGSSKQSASSYAPSASPSASHEGTPATGMEDVDATGVDEDVDATGVDDDDECDDEAGGDPDKREFICWVHPQCQTKQYTLALSRKMVSDYFGRNKKETQLVEEHRWIRACRKHYQRKSYQDSWRTYKGKVVIQQLHKIADQRPGVLFKVTLKSSEEKRLSDYLARLSNDDSLFDPEVREAKAKDDKNPDRSPLAVLREIKQFVHAHSQGDGDGMLNARDSEQLVNMAIQMVKDGRCVRLPLFEMLPQLAEDRTTPSRGKGKQVGVEDKRAEKPTSKKAAGSKRRGLAHGTGAKRQRV